MKPTHHIHSILALLVFIIGGVFSLSSPLSTLAQSVDLQIPIGDTKSITVCSEGICHGIALYIVEFAKWLVGALSMLAVLLIMMGGLIWLTSRADQKQVTLAKKLIFDSLGGLGLVLGSYLLLSVISPDLVNFSSGLKVSKIDLIMPEVDETGFITSDTRPSGTPTPVVSRGSAPMPGGGGIPNYNQAGGWGSPIARKGCALTALADVLEYYTKTTITPLMIYQKNGNSVIASWATTAKKFGGLKATALGDDFSKVPNLVSSGKPIIFQTARNANPRFTKDHHWLVIAAVEPGGTYTLNDPNGGKTWHGITEEQIRNPVTNKGDGTPRFMYIHP